jgi:hypothetical protein
MICIYGMFFFCMSGTNNDTNVLYKSPTLYNYLEEKANGLTFDVNGCTYPSYYSLHPKLVECFKKYICPKLGDLFSI